MWGAGKFALIMALLLAALAAGGGDAEAQRRRGSRHDRHADDCRVPGCDWNEAEKHSGDAECCAASRPVICVYSFEIGRRHVYSQYLAPVDYSGVQYAISGRWSKAMPFAPRRAMMSFGARVAVFPTMFNPRKTASMMGVDVGFSWSMSAYWRTSRNFMFSIGGGPDLEAGGVALLKNSNNPAAPNLAASLAIDASAGWRGRIGRLPMEASYRIRMPLAGAFFMMGYGETYYELWVGNRTDLVHFGWPGNRQKVDSHLTLRLDFGKTAMELGYRFELNRAHANNQTYRFYSNAFTIGVIPGGLKLKSSKPRLP